MVDDSGAAVTPLTNQDDEDMTPMHMTIFGAWYGGLGGQQSSSTCSHDEPRSEDGELQEFHATHSSRSSLITHSTQIHKNLEDNLQDEEPDGNTI